MAAFLFTMTLSAFASDGYGYSVLASILGGLCLFAVLSSLAFLLDGVASATTRQAQSELIAESEVDEANT